MENFSKMEQLALKYQQFYYELLPDWFLYTSKDYEYIKQRIRFALSGLSECDEDKQPINNWATNSSTSNDDKQLRKMISNIYEKILCYGKSKNHYGGDIYMSIIYNVAFNHNALDQNSNEIYALPIFKVKINVTNVLYIDSNARVYDSWEDYVKNNTLPKCMMIIPRDGVYQCNPHCKVTKRSSTVWTYMIQSPACGIAKRVGNVVDIASGIAGITAGVGIGVASLFTPVGPILIGAGLASSVVTGGWTIGRSAERLIDRVTHKESISPLESDALSAWIGLTSSVFNIAANSGTMLLSKAIAQGSNIGSAAKIAYNSTLISSLTVSGCGIVYQGYHLIDQYKTHKKVDMVDMIMFSSQVLFFGNSLVNMKLANELIGTSNGTVLEKFKNMLRFERLEQEYNRLLGGESNSEGIIHHFTKIQDAKAFLDNHNMKLQFVGGMIALNGITLIDPFIVVEPLLKFGVTALVGAPAGSLLNKKIVFGLKRLLAKLLNDFFSEQPSSSNKQYKVVSKLNGMLDEMANMNNCKKLLTMIFQIGTRLVLAKEDPSQLLLDAIWFVWEYSKANLKQNTTDNCPRLQGNSELYTLLTKIVTNLFDFINELADEMCSAFYSYMFVKNDIVCL